MFKSLKELDINWLKKNHQMIHFFGLGFIQLKINDEYRLHFYHPDLPPFVESPHNHRYDFLSTTLKGKIIHDFYSLTEGDDWIVYDENCQEGEDIPTNEKDCSIKHEETREVKEGESIFLDHQKFHTVKAENCITLLKRSEYKKDLAQVLLNKKDEKVCPFAKKIDEETLWKLVEEMITKV